MASRSRPKPSTASPATIGTQIASDRYGALKARPAGSPPRPHCTLRATPRRRASASWGSRVAAPSVPRLDLRSRPARSPPRPRSSHAPPVKEAEDADDHHERVVVDVARLDPAEFPRHEGHELRRAVDEPA